MIQGVVSCLRMSALVLLVFGLFACGGAPDYNNAGGNNSGSSTTLIRFVSVEPDQLALINRGGDDIAMVTFQVTNATGDTLSGVRVNFELSTDIGGLALTGDSSVETGNDGTAVAFVQSGNIPVSVVVTATIDQTSTRAVSDAIDISTSTFIAGRFGIGPNASDVTGNNGVEDGAALFNKTVGFGVIASDQFGHSILDGERVTFVAPMYGRFEPATCQFSSGTCETTFYTGTNPDVAANVPYTERVIAYTTGAEEFVDLNGNNIYDVNEEFVDLGEAWLDENGNGVYDAGEFWVDAGDKNGVYDPVGNGVWDGPCIEIPGEDEADESERCQGNENGVTIWSTNYLNMLAAEAE